MELRGRTAWVTGASAGIGESLAYELSRRGARLILSSRSAERLERVRQRCAGEPGSVRVLPLDLSHLDGLGTKAAEALSLFGGIDLLVNNGGVSQRSLVRDTDFEVDRHIMTVNYLAQVALTKAVLPHMLERRAGHIVVVSSIMGKLSTPLRSAYCASKHALHGYFDALRAEVWSDNVRVTIACPASIRTGISRSALTGNGRPHGKMDPQQEKGLSAEACARRILDAVARGKDEVLIGPPVRHVYQLKRFTPGLYAWIIRRAKVT